MIRKERVKTIIDIFLVLMLLLVSIKKGGFYKNDCLEVQLVITGIGMIYIVCDYFYEIFLKKIRKKAKENVTPIKIDVIEVLLFLFSIAYLIPILFNNASNLSDSIFEMIRYIDLWIVYCIAKRSNHQNIYMIGMLVITLIQCLLAIDGIANRYFSHILEHVNSGYLTLNNLTRMSGTIQYANVFSLLCTLFNIYLIDYLVNTQFSLSLKKKRKIFHYVIVIWLLFVYSSSIFLAKSRMLLFINMLYMIYVLCQKGKKNKKILIFNIFMVLIYCIIVHQILQNHPGYLYLVTGIFYLLHIGIFLGLLVFFQKKEKNARMENLQDKKRKKKFQYGIIAFISVIYVISIFLIKIPIRLNSNANQKYISRNIYQLNKNEENEICVKIKPLQEDARFKVHFIEVNDKLETKTIESFSYYSNVSNMYTISYIPPENFNYLIVHIECEKESIKVTDILVNQEKNYLDFALFPSDLMYRMIDSIHSDSSLKERIYFTKDAIKIISKTPQNFFFGVGGDGFKNTYEQVNTGEYASTEVHNVYLQIFVETGLIGFLLFLFLICFALKNSKKQITTLLLIIFLITSLFDLNFSFMLMMLLFAILLAFTQQKEDSKKAKQRKGKYIERYIWHGYKIISACFVVIVFILLFRATIACYMKVPVINEKEVTFKEMAYCVSKYEKRVMLDPFENHYRQALLEEYEKYSKVLKMYLNQNDHEILKLEYQNVLENRIKNIQMMQRNEKYNMQNYLVMVEYIFNEMEDLIKIGNFKSKEDGYCYYLNFIIENLEYIKKLKNDFNTSEKLEFFQKQLIEKINQIKMENKNFKIEKIIPYLK